MNNIFEYLKRNKKSQDNTPIYCDYGDSRARNFSEYLEGMHSKKFVRFPSKYFDDMSREIIENPNCSYETYMDELLKEGHIPEYYSVLLKNDYDNDYFVYNEVLASRICNQMGINTVYNKKITIDQKNYLASVDFLKADEKIIDMNNLIAEIHGDSLDYNIFTCGDDKLPTQMWDLYQVIDMNKARARNNAWKFDRIKYSEDYVYFFLVRRLIINDQDFFPRNFCNIVDKDNNMRLGPVYDCELGFGKENMNKTDKENLEYIATRWPHVLQKFFKKYSQLMKTNNFDKLFDDIDDKKYVKVTKKEMKNCYKDFMKNWQKNDYLEEACK